ncbi:Phosphoenolpyruvate synthase [uncultured Desulfobacterium sp.]|uniref:Phosphoenolpyruvate synthase n=1 Tax=uncultured Desulfobacterium sp. TaxID=201089 RepID=A0A445MWS1_9BACT|nr:Phosphoenolpyruvate synthase [uncultured Desulfobacterium sp.]
MLERLIRFFKKVRKQHPSDSETSNIFRNKYISFKTILESNSELLNFISDLEDKLSGERVFGLSYIRSQTARLVFHTARMIKGFEELAGHGYPSLSGTLRHIQSVISEELAQKSPRKASAYVLPYFEIIKEMTGVTGGKSANLGEIASYIGLPVPKGFAITTTAFDEFISANDLMDEINKQRMELNADDPESIVRVSRNIQDMFMQAQVPEPIRNAIINAYTRFVDPDGPSPTSVKVAMRSSAIGEDSDLSFAGQYLSVLNLPGDKIIEGYVRVISSLFTPRAISYRLHMGFPFEEVSMGVACIAMVDAKASGVVYTHNPINPLEDNVIINALWGLGTFVVDGVITPDSYIMSKGADPVLLESKIANKPRRMGMKADGDIMEYPVDPQMQDIPCLSEEQARLLAKYAGKIEAHYRQPQDIEWAMDQEDNLLILQSRPLRIEGKKEVAITSEKLAEYKLILEGGNIAFAGVGSGPAYHIHSESDLASFPEGGVLLAAHSSPQYVMVMTKASAIVTDSGSVTGHMASLAREFRVPTVLNLHGATSSIKEGEVITVDAHAGRIYQGYVPELLEMQVKKGSFMKGTTVYETLKRLSQFIIPLNLTDPKSAGFTPAECKTIHDIMRYIHECAYGEIFQLSDHTTDSANISVKLKANLPLDLHVIDLGGGLKEGKKKDRRKIYVDDVVSVPFKAILEGMLHVKSRYMEPRPVDFKGFFSVMSEQALSPPHMGAERFGDKSYAIISDKYLNFSSRIGYHYSVLDAYCGLTSTKNYINFTFQGGAADGIRRNRRARLIKQVLKALEFLVEVKADRVSARFAKQPQEVVFEKLDQLGRLIIYTQQMDMLMHTEDSVMHLSECFLKGDYTIKCKME